MPGEGVVLSPFVLCNDVYGPAQLLNILSHLRTNQTLQSQPGKYGGFSSESSLHGATQNIMKSRQELDKYFKLSRLPTIPMTKCTLGQNGVKTHQSLRHVHMVFALTPCSRRKFMKASFLQARERSVANASILKPCPIIQGPYTFEREGARGLQERKKSSRERRERERVSRERRRRRSRSVDPSQ